jgi:hypothetical protein
MFENLKKDENIEAPTDSIGGSGLFLSELYDATVDMAYIEKSQHGATGVVMHFKTDNNRYYRETLWVTNREGKHIWNKNGRSGYLPGFVLFDEMCVHMTGKEASEMPAPETKTIKVYNFDEKKDMATEKPVLVSLLGQRVKLGITQFKEDHYKDANTWAEKNSIDKVFGIDGITVSEKAAGLTESGFSAKWLEKYKDTVVDKRKQSKAGNKYVFSGNASAAAGDGTNAAAAVDAPASTPSLFATDDAAS